MKKTLVILYILAVTFTTLATGCEKREEPLGDIILPPAPLVSENESWAVIESSYLRLRERPEANSRLVTTLWRGYVLEVVSRSPNKVYMDDEEDYWYQVSYDGLQGWVFGSYLAVFDSREEAVTKARAIRTD